MITAGLIHYVLNLLHITVHIRDVCVFLAPVFSGLTAISTFLLTRELWNQGAGLLAACFIAIVPGYISRSVAGSFDNEGIAIFALQFTYYLWVCTEESFLSECEENSFSTVYFPCWSLFSLVSLIIVFDLLLKWYTLLLLIFLYQEFKNVKRPVQQTMRRFSCFRNVIFYYNV